MDSDGRLGSDEFVLAMHLCDLAKAGEQIPNTLPLELIPPTFRRQRQGSLTQSQGSVESIDPSAGMPQVYNSLCLILCWIIIRHTFFLLYFIFILYKDFI